MRQAKQSEAEADKFAIEYLPWPLYNGGEPAYEVVLPALTALFGLVRLGEPTAVSVEDSSDHPSAYARFLDMLEEMGSAKLRTDLAYLISELPDLCH